MARHALRYVGLDVHKQFVEVCILDASGRVLRRCRTGCRRDELESFARTTLRPTDRVALGRFLLVRGADPRQVLELMYDPVRKDSPKFVDVYFATAELALDKFDNALAAQTLRAAPEAVAWSSSSNPRWARAAASQL